VNEDSNYPDELAYLDGLGQFGAIDVFSAALRLAEQFPGLTPTEVRAIVAHWHGTSTPRDPGSTNPATPTKYADRYPPKHPCPKHSAYEVTSCPGCGTETKIGR